MMIVKSLLGIFLTILLLVSTTQQAPARRRNARPVFSDRVETFLRNMNSEGMTDREKMKYLGEILSALSYYKYDDPNFLEHCGGKKIVQDGYRDVQRQPYDQSREKMYGYGGRGANGDHSDDEYGDYDGQQYNQYDRNPPMKGNRGRDPKLSRYNIYGSSTTPSQDDRRKGSQRGGEDEYGGYDGHQQDNRGRRPVMGNSGRDRPNSRYNGYGTSRPNQDRQRTNNRGEDDEYGEYDDNQYGRTDGRRGNNRDRPSSGRSHPSHERGIDGHGVSSTEESAGNHGEYDQYDESDPQYDNHDQDEDLNHHENYDYYDQAEEDDEDEDHSYQEQSIDGHNPQGSERQRDRDSYDRRGSQSDRNIPSRDNDYSDESRSREITGRDGEMDHHSQGSDHDSHGVDDDQGEDHGSRRGSSYDHAGYENNQRDGENHDDGYGRHHDEDYDAHRDGYDPYRASESDAQGTYHTADGQDDRQDHYGHQDGDQGIHGEPYSPYGNQSPYITGETGDHSGDYDNSHYDPNLVEEYLSRIYLHDIPTDLAQYAESYLQYAKDSVRSSATYVKNFENIRPCLEHLVQYFNILTDNLASEYKRCSTRCYYDRLTNFTSSVSQYTRTTTECIQNRRH